MKRTKDDDERVSSLAALLKQKPHRGRPRRAVSRQNVYVALRDEEKVLMDRLVDYLPAGLVRADLPDLAISVLTAHIEALRLAVAGRNREIPEGVTDIESLYLLWDLSLPPEDVPQKWTSIRVSPQQALELGRAHGTLNAAFGVNRSQVYSLSLALLEQFLTSHSLGPEPITLLELREIIFRL